MVLAPALASWQNLQRQGALENCERNRKWVFVIINDDSDLSSVHHLLAQPMGLLPHLVFILVDDLGHGNVGFHRTEVHPPPEVVTPRMDALVAAGMVLDRHYVFKMCTPSRSSFLSGRFPVHVTQHLREPEEPNAGVPRNMTGIAEVLKQAGYATHQVGKWDAGMATPKHTPKGRGFETSLGYFEHKAPIPADRTHPLGGYLLVLLNAVECWGAALVAAE